VSKRANFCHRDTEAQRIEEKEPEFEAANPSRDLSSAVLVREDRKRAVFCFFVDVKSGIIGTGFHSFMIHVGPIELDESRLAEICRRYGVRQLSVFGSAARGEARPNSDIDLLVEFLPEAEPGLLDHAGLMLDLSELLGRKVDLVSKNGLKPLIRDSVIQDSRRLYAA